eukprot:55309-Eustigmatos_ZCMA.PRE.1
MTRIDHRQPKQRKRHAKDSRIAHPRSAPHATHRGHDRSPGQEEAPHLACAERSASVHASASDSRRTWARRQA